MLIVKVLYMHPSKLCGGIPVAEALIVNNSPPFIQLP